MLGSMEQVWVTSATCDDQVEMALVLCHSLRRTHTSRIVAVIASPKISLNLRDALNFGFDLVFYLEEDRNTVQLKPDDFAKLYSLLALRSFKNCAYVSPSMLAVQNCDDIFEMQTDGFVLLDDDAHGDVFLFKPSFSYFHALETGIKNGSLNGSKIGTYMKKWIKNQFNHVETLNGKFNKVLMAGKPLLCHKEDISLVNLRNYPNKSDIMTLKNTGLLGQLVLVHWLKIRDEDVMPLIKDSMSDHATLRNEHFISSRYNKEPIAIVGMSCRFPGSNNIEEFWELLFEGQDGTCNPPPFRWMREQCSRQMPHARKTNAGFLKVPVDEFDSKFFGISPKEMISIDPQHRLMHELIWEGLEDACIDPHTLRGTSGSVFMGSWTNDYKDIIGHSGNREFYRGYMGNSIGAATARLSFLLGLTGPSIATESGCSSAMVAVHLACRSLLNGETNIALAGGVNLLLHPFDKDEMPMVISPDGHSKTFSEDANGFARAEGCGVLVLKRLSDAIRDNDNIWALIRGSAIAQEGLSNSMGTPTVHCESIAMNDALMDANVRPEEVSYVEAHGTGTIVGDPMEIAAIAKAYHSPARKHPLVIGSVKTNVGHTESCSGITGIMKVVLSMLHETIPAHRNFTKLNPNINLDAVPAIIPLERMEWKKTSGKPRIAGVSSFGITGTDAHAIIEESPQNETSKALTLDGVIERPVHILKMSAKTEEALEILMARIREYLTTSEESLADIAYSLNAGRASFNYRVAVIAKTKEQAASCIEQKKYSIGEVNPDSLGKVCFLFTGQGSQYPGMAKMLYEHSPIFQTHFDYCENIMNDCYNISLKKILWSEKESSEEQISRTIYSQTSIFCVEYALLKLWGSWGVKPDYALGHSLGEFAAAVCAGIISVEDAIKLVAERSRLIDELPHGKMLVIQADLNEVQNKMKAFAGNDAHKMLEYAAVNSSTQTVVAGDSHAIMEFSQFLTTNKLKCIVLASTHAFHSKHMDPMLEKYRAVAKTIKPLQNQTCEYISGMFGDVVQKKEMNAEYWVQHTREKVNFLSASKKAIELGCNIFIEIGPQPVLTALTMMNSDVSLLCLPSLKRKADEWETILNTLGKLYVNGMEINWNGLDQFYNRKKARLPHYPFIGKKFWPEISQATGNAIHPLVGALMPNASSLKIFQCGLNLRSHEYIKDHSIGQTVVFPGAGYLEMSLAAGLATVEGSVDVLSKPSRPMKVENLLIKAPLALQDSKACQLQTVVELNRSEENKYDWNDVTVKIYHRVDSESVENKWLEHAVGIFSPLPSAEEQAVSFDVDKFHSTLSQSTPDMDHILDAYDKLASLGLKFGPAFRSLENMWKNDNDGSLVAKVKIPTESDAQPAHYIIHPVVLDAMIQAIMMLKVASKLNAKLFVPIKIGYFLWISNSTDESNERYIHVFEKSDLNSKINSDTNLVTALLLDSKGTVLAVMSGVEFIDTTVKAVESVLEQQTSTMPNLWEESWRPRLGPLQHRHDVSLCRQEKFYTDELMEDVMENYNKMSPELEETFKNLEQMVYYNMIRCLYQCGWVPVLNQIIEERKFREQLGVQKEFFQLFSFMLSILEQEGVLKNMDSFEWKVIAVPPPMEKLEELLIACKFTVDLVKEFKPTLLFAKIGENYSKILKGELSALPILFPGEGSKVEWPPVADFYTDYANHFKYAQLNDVIAREDLRHCKGHYNGHKNVIRILEVGAGTGSFTKAFIETLIDTDIEFEYTYTDISAAFFPAAEKKFEKYLKYMTFKKLNIEEDPISQGFPPNYFDYIFASDVIHATRNLKITLKNVNTLLRTGAKFIMNDMTKVNRFITFLFGLLEGFWRFEDTDLRKNHCTLSTEKWTEVLGDSGLDVLQVFPSVNNHHGFFWTYKAEDCKLLSIKETPDTKPTTSWIVFHQEDSPTSNYLLKKIGTLENRDVISVTRGDKFQRHSVGNEWRFQIRIDSEEDFFKMMQFIETEKKCVVDGVLFGWSLDKNSITQEFVLQPYFHAIKAVLRMKQNPTPKIVALVNGVMPVEDNDLFGFHSSTIWGFTKALRNERVDINCRVIDIGGKEDAEGVQQVFLELWSTSKDTQVAFHDTTRYVCKIQAHKPSLYDLKLPKGTDRFQLILPDTKSIGDLQFGPLQTLILGDDEIEIQVKASALNFKDIFNIMKPSDDFKDSNAVGFDFAGVVKRVGPKVNMWAIGDRVFGLNVNGEPLPSHIKLNERDVLAVPDGMSFCDACTLPAVVATSYHCLFDVAKIRGADTVLIHAASGGVGLSAIQICKSVGARIIATAGSKRKQNYLKSLGIKHIFHSRNTDYGDQILKVTNGRGVDVVLNSLTSEGFKEATLKACAIGARFVEMSKLSIWKAEEVKKIRPDVQYTIVDLSAFSLEESRRVMAQVHKLTENNVINPMPYVRFDAAHIREALQYMQKAKHIGKVVCEMPEVRQQNGNCEVHTPMFNANATYLITGGLGGIGFVVCKWMVEKGARHVLLGSRSVPTESMQQSIRMLNTENRANVQAFQLDVGDFQQCRDLIQVKIPEMGLPPLRGVMHAAGTLSDGLIENQTWGKLSSTFETKIKGTWNLHELTKTTSLEHFVLFSSISALFGSPGQSNHSAGNSFEDAFAQYRNSIGLPATSINWGQWGEVGIATEIDLPGLKTLSNLQGTTGLEYAMKSQRTQTTVLNVESFVLFSKLLPHISSILDESVWKSSNSAAGVGGMLMKSEEFWQHYDSLLDLEAKLEMVKELLRRILINILRLEDSDVIEDNANFQEMGVDSLMFVEIKNSIQALFGDRVSVNASAMRDCNTINLLADALVKIIEGEGQEEEQIPTLEEVAELIKEDCQLAEHVIRKPGQEKGKIEDVSTVLITGCTGTFGPYVLRELTNNSQVTHVICLMRPHKNVSLESRLRKILESRELISQVNMNKVRCVDGDVASAKLGMESTVWEEMCNSVDAVFHCAAHVDHAEHYRKCNSRKNARTVNVGGTKNILEFACTGSKLKQVFYASSLLAVSTLDEDGGVSETWPQLNDYDCITTLAYPITKFVGDMLIKQAVTERGIPGKIFRFPLIMGDSKTGSYVIEKNHAMLRYMFILQQGVMPSTPMPMAMLPVDICASASVRIFLNPNAPDDVYNVSNMTPGVDQEFVDVAKRLGYSVDTVEFSEFMEKIREAATDDSPFAIFRELYKSRDEDLLSIYNASPSLRQWIVIGGADKTFGISKKIINFLPEFNNECYSSMDCIYRDLLYAKNKGWFAKFKL